MNMNEMYLLWWTQEGAPWVAMNSTACTMCINRLGYLSPFNLIGLLTTFFFFLCDGQVIVAVAVLCVLQKIIKKATWRRGQ
jgi:hypothetical protein